MRQSDSALPLYHRVFLLLRDRLVAGDYPLSRPLPGELQLADELGVSRATIRRALAMLDAVGLVSRRQGAGTYPRLLGRYAYRQAQNLGLLGSGAGRSQELFAGDVRAVVSEVPVPEELLRNFPGEDVLTRVERVRFLEGRPDSYIVSHVTNATASAAALAAASNEPLIELLSRSGFRFSRVEQAIAATTADSNLADVLELPLGAALLRITGCFFAEDDQLIMHKSGYFLANSYRYETTLPMRDI